MKSNREDFQRIGCDICKENKSTEKFEGYCGGVVWICGDCYKIIIQEAKELKKAKEDE